MAETASKKQKDQQDTRQGKEEQDKNEYTAEEIRGMRLEILQHDLHKVDDGDDYSHYTLPSPLKEADIIAARMARSIALRRYDYEEVDNRLRISHADCCVVTDKLPSADKVMEIFNHNDPSIIHAMVLQSEELTCYNESKSYPFTSLKHHLLLATSLAENFRETGKTTLKGLKLCLSFDPPRNIYKLVGRALTKKRKKWTTLYLYIDSEYTGKGNASVAYCWKNTWNNVYGFKPETVLLGMNVMATGSWTEALVTLEKAKQICRIGK